MQTLPFSTRARVALGIARSIAAAYGHKDLTGVHIGLGLLREGENAALAALAATGRFEHGIRHEFEDALGKPLRPELEQVALEQTAGERRLIEEARREAIGRKDPYLGPEHLLLAILRDSGSAAAEIFSRRGIAPAALESALDTIFAAHPPHSPPSN